MDSARLPQDWPYRAQSRRMRVTPHDWYVIDTGPQDAPVLLLLHGAGGSGHSFRALIPVLSDHYRVIVPDLPGQGCTRAGGMRRLGLDAMAEDLTRLCLSGGVAPQAVIGHSAGAAIGLRMADLLPLKGIVGINAALGTFDGAAGVMFPLMARALAATPFVGSAVSKLWGTPATVAKLLSGTGSPLDAAGQAQYLALVRDSAHVSGTLGMMAQWRLEGLMARLPSLANPVLLIASDGDNAVPPKVSRDAVAHMPNATYAEIAGFGHLVHEEAADQVADVLLPWLAARL
ncbi:MAG: alpha/beta fold hydrolase BchO [Pseudotabrizicola sp.]|uniref:alpha/beta fold hydrolase BchO n=1 Tax=Pseudotabrizicola sp. TaxID=2939647 RepID=UPI00273020A9|nr:alpha/beta fold hydrolase BchO [Pseudotabrizicola sp.]MDP2079842.1 alpha/beta fold hydrolase [Pseudotabrizicola sp.]MDZ7574843.1 alpha/beta fold hydrolase BchO [Pseudotabrizicola sp.]